jgi:VWFA-related protein
MSQKIQTTLVTLGLLLTSAAAQQPATTPAPPPQQSQPQEEVVRISTSVVQFEAIVTDKSGRRVTGLKAEDFQLADEGKPRPVDFFAAVEGSQVKARSAAPAPGATTPASGTTTPVPGASAPQSSPLMTPFEGRFIALVFDDANLTGDNFTRARRALADYINAKMTPGDMAAVVTTSGSFGSLQQLTNDKQRLLSALGRINASSGVARHTPGQRFDMTLSEAMRIDSGDQNALNAVKQRVASEETASPTGTYVEQLRGGATGAQGLRGDQNQTGSEPIDAAIRVAAKARVGEVTNATRNTLRTLSSIVNGMSELPGRKIVVFLTESLMTAGGTSGDVNDQLQHLIDDARRGAISVYALDAAGLRAGNTTAEEHITGSALSQRSLDINSSTSDFEKLGAARALVAGTGGELIANTNDLVAGLNRAIEDSSSYYVIGFAPEALDNKFHRLSLTVKGRPDLLVRTRRGYLAINQETVRKTNAELVAALLSPVPRTELPLELVANVVPQGGEQVVLSGLHLGRNYLSLPSASAPEQKASYELVIWVFQNGQDKPVGIVSRTISYDLAAQPEDRQKLSTGGFAFVPQPFKLNPGQYQIRAVVREQSSGAVGSAYQFFEVPDLTDRKGVSASSVLLNEAGKTGFGGANSFKRSTEVDVRFIIYNMPKDSAELTQRVRLIDAQGKALLDSPLPMSANAEASSPNMFPQATRLKLPPARGRYALVVNLQDKKGKIDIERRADFVVE